MHQCVQEHGLLAKADTNTRYLYTWSKNDVISSAWKHYYTL